MVSPREDESSKTQSGPSDRGIYGIKGYVTVLNTKGHGAADDWLAHRARDLATALDDVLVGFLDRDFRGHVLVRKARQVLRAAKKGGLL